MGPVFSFEKLLDSLDLCQLVLNLPIGFADIDNDVMRKIPFRCNHLTHILEMSYCILKGKVAIFQDLF